MKNFRFTQNMVEAFKTLSAVGGDAVPVGGWGLMSCPPMRLDNFNFSSSTKF